MIKENNMKIERADILQWVGRSFGLPSIFDGVSDCKVGWLIGWLTDWLIDRLIDDTM